MMAQRYLTSFLGTLALLVLTLHCFFRVRGIPFLSDIKSIALEKTEQVGEYIDCTAGVIAVDSVKILQNNIDMLECIFWAGVAPKEPPLGNMVLKTLTAKHSERFGALLDKYLQGHIFTETMCNKGETKHFDQPSIQFGIRPTTGLVSISELKIPLAEGEYNNKTPVISIDYGIDFKTECRAEGIDFPGWLGLSTEGFAPYSPINPPGSGIYYDAAKIVGFESGTGCAIILEKVYTNTPNGYVTIGFVTGVSCDPRAIATRFQFITMQPFTYYQKSGRSIFRDMLAAVPADFLTLPIFSFNLFNGLLSP